MFLHVRAINETADLQSNKKNKSLSAPSYIFKLYLKKRKEKDFHMKIFLSCLHNDVLVNPELQVKRAVDLVS